MTHECWLEVRRGEEIYQALLAAYSLEACPDELEAVWLGDPEDSFLVVGAEEGARFAVQLRVVPPSLDLATPVDLVDHLEVGMIVCQRRLATRVGARRGFTPRSRLISH